MVYGFIRENKQIWDWWKGSVEFQWYQVIHNRWGNRDEKRNRIGRIGDDYGGKDELGMGLLGGVWWSIERLIN